MCLTVDASFIFTKKSNVAKWFFDIFNAEIAQCRQKLDVILGTKVVQFWSYQKMYFTQNVVLNWYSSMNFFFRMFWPSVQTLERPENCVIFLCLFQFSEQLCLQTTMDRKKLIWYFSWLFLLISCLSGYQLC